MKKINKSQIVREVLESDLEAKPLATSKMLSRRYSRRGVEFTPHFISMIKNQMKSKDKDKEEEQPETDQPSIQIDALLAVRKFADDCGGIEQARQALDVFAKITN